MVAAAIRIGMSLVFLVAGLTQLLGLGHWVQVFGQLGAEPVARYVVALASLGAVGLFWWPGRRGYGAAVMLALSVAAVIAHLAALGVSSAPPAVLLAVLSGLVTRASRADFRR